LSPLLDFRFSLNMLLLWQQIEEVTEISVLDQKLYFRQTELDDLNDIVLGGPAGFVRGEVSCCMRVADLADGVLTPSVLRRH